MTTDGTSRSLLTRAAQQVTTALSALDPDSAVRRDAPTPCRDFDLGALVEHVLGTTTMLAGVGRRDETPTDPPRMSDQWPRDLSATIATVAEVWSVPQVWDGTVSMGGHDMPAAMIGDMVFAEILLHGWDLARATGTTLEVDDELGSTLRRGVEDTAELGRQMKAYGDRVRVAEDASDFDHALGAAGRDPDWRA